MSEVLGAVSGTHCKHSQTAVSLNRLYLRSLKVSVFMKTTLSQTQQKAHALYCPVENTLCVDNPGELVQD